MSSFPVTQRQTLGLSSAGEVNFVKEIRLDLTSARLPQLHAPRPNQL